MLSAFGGYEFHGDHLLSSEHIRINEEINSRYPNLVLQFIPAADRETEEEKTYPFAIFDMQTNQVVKKLKEEEMNYHRILQWLYDNDGSRVGEQELWNRLVKEMEAEKRERDKKNEEVAGEAADVMHTIITSPKHTFRHNGHKIGAENNRPSITPRNE